MKKVFFSFFAILFIVLACREPEFTTDFHIKNETSHFISLNNFYNETCDSIHIPAYTIYDAGTVSGTGWVQEAPPFIADSVIVCYNNLTCTPFNWTEQGSPQTRNILYPQSWNCFNSSDAKTCEYTFTDADYQEAVEANAGNK